MSGGEPRADRCAWITGGASGIGLATARRLAAAGVRVRILDRDEAGGLGAAASIREAGGVCRATVVELADPDGLDDALTRAFAEDEGLDILVNAAGMARRQPLAQTSLDDWRAVLDVNLTAPFLLCRAAAGRMVGNGGRIVNVASHSALLGSVGRGAYAAAKSGLAGMTRVLAVELASRGITVNAVAPGPVDTAMTAAHDVRQRALWESAVPLARYGTADEVAAGITFLASREASYITGQMLCIDGGFSAAGLLA